MPQTEWKLDSMTPSTAKDHYRHCLKCGHRSGVDHAGICWACHNEFVCYPELPIIRAPGANEGNHRYVPYYWSQGLEGMADRDRNGIFGFDVSPEDKAIFPELKRRRCVNLYQRDDGFICEI